MKRSSSAALAFVLAFAPLASAALLSTACGGSDKDDLYQPKGAPSGKKATMPPVPTLPQKPKKVGDSYTIWGATHDLRSKVLVDEIKGKKISITGYVIKTNYKDAPVCSVHKTGKGDPADCKGVPLPTFWIADDKGEAKDAIPVMGWASNFAQVFSLIEAIDKAAKGKESEVKLADEFWGQDLPNPVPNVGAKVKITGTYDITFAKATGGAASDPKYGIVNAEKIEFVEPPTEKAYLPGMKAKK